MDAYCSAQDGLDYVAGLRTNSNDSSINLEEIESEGEEKADDIREKVVGRFGYEPIGDTQLAILKNLNGVLLAQNLMDYCANTVDAKLLGIVKQQKDFTDNDYKLAKVDRFFRAFNPETVGYPEGIPLIRPTHRAIQFTGIGQNTLLSSGNYTGKDGCVFTVEILSNTTFKWKKDTGSFSSPITITLSPQTLSDGVSIEIANGSHSEGDAWLITITSFASIATLKAAVPTWEPDEKQNLSTESANAWLDQSTAIVYALAVTHYSQGDRTNHLGNLTKPQARKYGRLITLRVAAFLLQAKAFVSARSQADVAALAIMNEYLKMRDELLRGQWLQTFPPNN